MTTANRDAIRADLRAMVARWAELPEPAVFEVRALAEGKQPQNARFKPDWIEDAVDWCASMNALGFNIYTVRNPIRASAGRSASDADILASLYLWADCDDETSEGNVRRFDGPRHSHAVVTGRVPHTRVHVYWELDTPVTDMDAWRALQTDIAAHFKSDSTVVNPSRIMRVAGTVAHPAAHKRARGYITELCEARPGPGSPVPFQQMRRVFAHATQAPAPAAAFQIDTGAAFQSLDRERMAIQAQSGMEWHNSVVRLVASYVARGLTDAEIHALTDPLTLQGYTVDQTRREVQTAINGARAKGWTPAPDAQITAVRDLTTGEKDAIPALPWQPWGHRDLEAIPYPEFVYSDFYARGYTSVTLAPPKVGKSMLGLAEAIDIATGRGILTGHQRPAQRVVYYNAEDDMSVLEARTAALLTRYGIDQTEIAESLFLVSGVEAEGFYLISGQDGIINEPLFVSLEKFIGQSRADVLIFDPLQDLSRSPETNEVFRLLGQRLRRLATAHSVAIGLIHHTRKIAPGATATIEDGRGGSALRGTARFNRLLISMTEDEAAKAGVQNHRNFLRVGDMESNLAPPSSDVNRWFQKVSILTPNGTQVGAIEPWQWPDAFEGVTPDDARRVQLAIAAADEPPRANGQSATWAGIVVASVLGWDHTDKATRARIGNLLKTWIKSGVLAAETVRDGRNGRDVPVIVAGPNNPKTESQG